MSSKKRHFDIAKRTPLGIVYQRRAETWSAPLTGLLCCPLFGLQTPQLRQMRTRSTLTRLRRPRNISESSANARKPSRFHFANLVGRSVSLHSGTREDGRGGPLWDVFHPRKYIYKIGTHSRGVTGTVDISLDFFDGVIML